MDFAPILLVEDDADDVELTRRAFAMAGFPHAIAPVPDGPSALRYLGQAADAGKPPRLVLLDMRLGPEDGLELVRALRRDARLVGVPAVVLSSSEDPEDVRQSYLAGAFGYVRKPRTAEEFLVTARHVGMYWLELNLVQPVPTGS